MCQNRPHELSTWEWMKQKRVTFFYKIEVQEFWNVFVADVERKDVRRIFYFLFFFERGSIVVLKMCKF